MKHFDWGLAIMSFIFAFIGWIGVLNTLSPWPLIPLFLAVTCSILYFYRIMKKIA